jgi:hypothetical protein
LTVSNSRRDNTKSTTGHLLDPLWQDRFSFFGSSLCLTKDENHPRSATTGGLFHLLLIPLTHLPMLVLSPCTIPQRYHIYSATGFCCFLSNCCLCHAQPAAAIWLSTGYCCFFNCCLVFISSRQCLYHQPPSWKMFAKEQDLALSSVTVVARTPSTFDR